MSLTLKRTIIGTSVFSFISILGFKLAIWQYYRMYEKKKLISDISEGLYKSPINLPLNIPFEISFNSQTDYTYKLVTINGRFDKSTFRLLGLNSAPYYTLSNHRVGYYILSPFIREDGTRVLVNRGWIPYNELNDFITEELNDTNEIKKITGFISPYKSSTKNNKTENKYIWTNVNYDKAKSELNINSYYIESIEISNENKRLHLKQKKNFVKFRTMPSIHLGYMMTWICLSTISGFIGYKKYLKHLIIKILNK